MRRDNITDVIMTFVTKKALPNILEIFGNSEKSLVSYRKFSMDKKKNPQPYIRITS